MLFEMFRAVVEIKNNWVLLFFRIRIVIQQNFKLIVVRRTEFGNTSYNTSTNFLWRLGAGAHFGPVGARLEWESIVVDGPTNLSMVSLSGTFGF
jgi:hypothetical protein